LPIPSGNKAVIDFSDRLFHLEVLCGGVNRLLLRSNRNSLWSTRVEILFMGVKYLDIGTSFDGILVEDLGPITEMQRTRWKIALPDDLHLFRIASSSGNGEVVAGSVAVDESDAATEDPSAFFMMD
jgi:hypothetical protein